MLRDGVIVFGIESIGSLLVYPGLTKRIPKEKLGLFKNIC